MSLRLIQDNLEYCAFTDFINVLEPLTIYTSCAVHERSNSMFIVIILDFILNPKSIHKLLKKSIFLLISYDPNDL